jgi:3'-phosphoadenosine 5'-phosphosulfate sulfotransferase (PAPS reductase)/FAD synthetase
VRADILSFGGGTQTCAMVELVLQGRLPRPERIVMADTGREATETWEYAEANAMPRLDRAGFKLEFASHHLSTVDLLAKNGQLLMPVFTANGEGQLPNFCSNEWKKRVVQRYLRQFGYGPCGCGSVSRPTNSSEPG